MLRNNFGNQWLTKLGSESHYIDFSAQRRPRSGPAQAQAAQGAGPGCTSRLECFYSTMLRGGRSKGRFKVAPMSLQGRSMVAPRKLECSSFWSTWCSGSSSWTSSMSRLPRAPCNHWARPGTPRPHPMSPHVVPWRPMTSHVAPCRAMSPHDGPTMTMRLSSSVCDWRSSSNSAGKRHLVLHDAARDVRRQQWWPRSVFLPFAGGCRRPPRGILQPRDAPRKQEDLDRRCSARRHCHAASVVFPGEHVGYCSENTNASPHASTQRGRRGSGLLEESP